jgi:NHL repeat
VLFKNLLSRSMLSLIYATLVFTSCEVPKDQPLSIGLLDGIKNADGAHVEITAAETLSSTKVKVTWRPSTNPNLAGYIIYDTTLLLSPKVIASTKDLTKTSLVLTDLTSQKYYSFKVRSVDAKGVEDANTKELGAIPYGGVLSAEVISSSSVKIKYNPAANADKVHIYCKVGFALVDTEVKVETDPTLTETTLTNLQAGVNYSCRAALDVGGFEDNNQERVDFMPLGAATQLKFVTQPSNTPAGTVFTAQPVVQILDAQNNLIVAGPDSSAQITLTFASNSVTQGAIIGTTTVTAVKGVATFSGLKINEAGLKILNAEKADTSAQTNGSAILDQASAEFSITPGPISSATSTITTNPNPPAADLVADGSVFYSVLITLKDEFGNAISGVKPQFASSISGDSLTQPSAFSNALGLATGSIKTTIADSVAPFRMLSISSPSGLSSVTVPAHFVPGAPAKLGFTVQPINSPGGALQMSTVKVAVQDANGNTVTTGAASTAVINLNINANVNGAVLSGTTSVAAVAGVATFTDLGIDKSATGYKLQASSGSYVSAYSNAFNITSGTPIKIAITSTSNFVVSSAQSSTPRNCSQPIIIKLLDGGNNPANAVQNTSLAVSGLGSAVLYGNSSCSGTALSSTLTFTAGTNTKTVYLLDPAGESITISIRDTSNVLATGTFVMNVLPNKISISAKMPSPPAAANTPMSVTSGVCSAPIIVTPMGENGNPAPLFSPTIVSLTGLTAASALFYTDSLCTQAVTASNISLPVTAGLSDYKIKLYMKDSMSEVLSLNIIDPLAAMTTTSSAQTITVLPSAIGFTGPSSVVAGICSGSTGAFRISLKDAQANLTPALTNTTLNINGLAGSATGLFYTNSTCSGTGFKNQVVIPQNSSYVDVYFKDTTAESLNIYISDPLVGMTNSPTLAIGISPAALLVTAPLPAKSDTTVCSAAFTINTMDGAAIPNVTRAITPITVNLTLAGYPTGFSSAGKFYIDSGCANDTTSLTFQAGEDTKYFYFMGHYPAANDSLTIAASDAAAVLATGSTTWAVTAKKGWLGTLGQMFNSNQHVNAVLSWFRTGVNLLVSSTDAAVGVRNLHFDSSKTFLYVVDRLGHRILKYDYLNQKYIGWIGGLLNSYGFNPIEGSHKSNDYPNLPSAAACKQTLDNTFVPGWCVGGAARAFADHTQGVMVAPEDLTDDGTYIYVVSSNSETVSRYNAESGAYAGWIGGVNSTPTGTAPGGVSGCSTAATGTVTPGWCIGGSAQRNSSLIGLGILNGAQAIASDNTFLYVGQWGSIFKYTKSNGAFAGWIGKAGSTPATGPGVGGVSGCTSLSNGQTTPGWCMGGLYRIANSGAEILQGGLYLVSSLKVDSVNDTLYATQQGYINGVVQKYRLSTGEYLGSLTGSSKNWNSTYAFTMDVITGNFYFADSSRVIATDSTGVIQGWLGKVASNSGLSDALGNTSGQCSSLQPNQNTTGWCLGGSVKQGLDELSFQTATALEDDGQGNILVGDFGQSLIKKFNKNTGAYVGALAPISASPTTWSNDAVSNSVDYGVGDHDFNRPTGSYTDRQYLYVSDSLNGRVKKINLSTGQLVGWVGAVTTSPTGGISTQCLATNPMSTVNGWCFGGLPNPWSWIGQNLLSSDQYNGLMYRPSGIAGDGTPTTEANYIYVVDQGLHRINKFNAKTGAFIGWIGKIATVPTGGDPGCTDSLNLAAVGKFTPGWCTGGMSTWGSGDGHLAYPSGITYSSNTGYIYVVDANNHRISSYDATTGAFKGWIGAIGTAPTSGCVTAANGSGYSVSTSGWCKGGVPRQANQYDRGGGYNFWTTSDSYVGISTDNTYLYVAHWYSYRIDKICLLPSCPNGASSGAWVGGASVNPYRYTGTWTNSPTDLVDTTKFSTNYSVIAIWSDSNSIYGVIGAWGAMIFKMNKATGQIIGWQGGIASGNSPSGGDPGCAGATSVTPGWCQGGGWALGNRMGQFNAAVNITGDDNYVYVTDLGTHRVTRFPK